MNLIKPKKKCKFSFIKRRRAQITKWVNRDFFIYNTKKFCNNKTQKWMAQFHNESFLVVQKKKEEGRLVSKGVWPEWQASIT